MAYLGQKSGQPKLPKLVSKISSSRSRFKPEPIGTPKTQTEALQSDCRCFVFFYPTQMLLFKRYFNPCFSERPILNDFKPYVFYMSYIQYIWCLLLLIGVS